MEAFSPQKGTPSWHMGLRESFYVPSRSNIPTTQSRAISFFYVAHSVPIHRSSRVKPSRPLYLCHVVVNLGIPSTGVIATLRDSFHIVAPKSIYHCLVFIFNTLPQREAIRPSFFDKSQNLTEHSMHMFISVTGWNTVSRECLSGFQWNITVVHLSTSDI